MMPVAEGRARTSFVVVLAVRGAVAVVLALSTAGLQMLAALVPRVTANVLLLLFGIYLLLDGALAVIASLRPVKRYDRWLRAQGVLSFCVGAAVLTRLVSIGAPLFYLIASWAIATGALELVAASDMRRRHGVGVLAVGGVASVVLAVVVLIAWPGAGLMPFMWLLAAYALLVGIVRIIAALR